MFERLLAAALVAGVMACGDSAPKQGATTTVPVPASTGATVTLATGPTLYVGAGALAVDTNITIRDSGQQSSEGTPVYEFGPAGTTFAKPVRITLAVPPGMTDAAIYFTTPGGTDFSQLPSTMTSDGMVEAFVSHFSRGFPGWDKLPRGTRTSKLQPASCDIRTLSGAAHFCIEWIPAMNAKADNDALQAYCPMLEDFRVTASAGYAANGCPATDRIGRCAGVNTAMTIQQAAQIGLTLGGIPSVPVTVHVYPPTAHDTAVGECAALPGRWLEP